MGFTALIAGGLGGLGSIGSALIGSNAAKQASQQQVGFGEQALAQQKDLFNQGLQTAQNTLLPYVNAGQKVLPTLQGLLTPGPNQNALLSQTPGFQFASQYGTMSATNALASRGLGASAGPVASAVSQYNNGLAQNTWGNLVQSLQNYANLGANSAGTLGTAALNGSIQAGNSQAGTLNNIGNAAAAGTLGSANALAGGLTGTTNALSSAALLSAIGGGGGGGLYSGFSGPAYGGGNFLADAYGGNPNNPLPGLTSADYG